MADRTSDLIADYEALGVAMTDAEGAALSSLVRERRMLRAQIEERDADGGDAVVDKLAGNVTRLDAKRRGRSGDRGAAAGRSKSG